MHPANNPHSADIRIAAVVAAGGTGTRIGASTPKQFLPLAGVPILLRSVASLLTLRSVNHVVVALPEEHIGEAESILARRLWSVPVLCVAGGATRQDSVWRGVQRSPADADLLMVHDAVRPFVDAGLLERIVAAALRIGGAVPALPATETIQRVSRRGRVLKTPPREELYAIQTPQCFRATVLRKALELAAREGFAGTDESSVVRWAGAPVEVVPGSPDNIKITRPLDLEIAAGILAREASAGQPGTAIGDPIMLRVGHGIDYHRLVVGRRLILGGVEIPFEKGLEGHSDADALIHAVCDAMLGAAALGDIGGIFPDSDPTNRDRSSLEFLSEIRDRLGAAGWQPLNVDATLLAQSPRLSPYFGTMRRNLAQSLRLPEDRVSVKATTTEGLNAEGRGEGISAHAVALLGRRTMEKSNSR